MQILFVLLIIMERRGACTADLTDPQTLTPPPTGILTNNTYCVFLILFFFPSTSRSIRIVFVQAADHEAIRLSLRCDRPTDYVLERVRRVYVIVYNTCRYTLKVIMRYTYDKLLLLLY